MAEIVTTAYDKKNNMSMILNSNKDKWWTAFSLSFSSVYMGYMAHCP